MNHDEKTSYTSQRKAIAAAIAYSKRGKALRVYRCPECPGWHLTSQARRSRKPSSA